MCEVRPHRQPLAPEEAARQLRGEVKAGRMDGDVVEAVLGAAGHRAM
jgi:HD-GYP domain-containing protein (c-di-GMP phosphodiesterase class II)